MSGKTVCKRSILSRFFGDPLSCMLFITSGLLFTFSLVFCLMSHLV